MNLAAAHAWAAQALTQEGVGEEITYRRGVLEATFYAFVDSTMLRTGDGQGGTLIERTDAEFVFPVGSLSLGGSATDPRTGDEIDRTIRGKVKTYRVMPVAGEQAWFYDDETEAKFRVRTKLVSSTDA